MSVNTKSINFFKKFILRNLFEDSGGCQKKISLNFDNYEKTICRIENFI